MAKVAIEIRETRDELRLLQDALTGEGRVEMVRAAGYEVQRSTADYLRQLAQTRHDTANALGATPSNHLAQAAEKVTQATVSVASGTGIETQAEFVLDHPGMSRAFHDVTIRPRNAKALTIPIAAIAYNRRAGQFDGLFVLGGRGADVGRNLLCRRLDDGTIEPLYLLVRSVTQKQDRSLLPSAEEWNEAALRGARTYLDMVLPKN